MENTSLARRQGWLLGLLGAVSACTRSRRFAIARTADHLFRRAAAAELAPGRCVMPLTTEIRSSASAASDREVDSSVSGWARWAAYEATRQAHSLSLAGQPRESAKRDLSSRRYRVAARQFSTHHVVKFAKARSYLFVVLPARASACSGPPSASATSAPD